MAGKPQYFYETLFTEGKSSDIAVKALGKVWNLHKRILSQSPYFKCMFSDSWKESRQDVIQIEILDDCITLNSLDAVFGAMYSNQIEIDSNEAISVLATAALFNLDGVIDKCEEVLIDSINKETVVHLYEAACRYGTPNLKKATFAFLEINLFHVMEPLTLRQINVDLMTKLVASADSLVYMEIILYEQLCYWMYLLLHPKCDKGRSEAKDFFVNRSDKRPFLALPEAQQFLPTFQALRTQHLINADLFLRNVLRDNIIPKQWLNSHVMDTWQFILNEGKVTENLEPEVFLKHCMRLRFTLGEPYDSKRLLLLNLGFNFDVFPLKNSLVIKRVHDKENERVVSLREKCPFMIRASIISLNSQRKPIFTQKSQILYLNLGIDEKSTLMNFDSELEYPIIASVNLLVVPPTDQSFKQTVLSSEEIEVHRNTAGEHTHKQEKEV